MTTDYIQLRQRVMDIIYAGLYPTRGTVVTGSTTTIVDAGIALPGASADRFDYHWVKIVKDAGGASAAPEAQIRAVSEAGYAASTGTLTVSAAFTVATAVGDTYEIHPPHLHPSELDDILFKKLRNFHAPAIFPLSLHLLANNDNDMEYSDATSWITPATGTEAKESTIVFNGAQSVKLTAAAANDYLTSLADFSVATGKSYCSAVMASIQDGDSGLFRMWDVTNGASIEVSATITQVDWTELVLQWTPPTGCLLVEPRLTSVGSNDVTYWDDYQTWVSGEHIYPLPSWITREEQVIDVVGYPQGRSIASFAYSADERKKYCLPWATDRTDMRADGPLKLYVHAGSARPYIVARRPLAVPTADYTAGAAQTVTLASDEADAVVDGASAEALRRLARRETGDQRAGMLRDAKEMEKNYNAKLAQINSMGKIVHQAMSTRVGAVMR